MTLTTFTDYLAAWLLLYVLFQLIYRAACSVANQKPDDDTVQQILVASVCVVVCLWAVRHLFF
jgi:divalent metal cation (Fe/Co/Zn/Cd) transporter